MPDATRFPVRCTGCHAVCATATGPQLPAGGGVVLRSMLRQLGLASAGTLDGDAIAQTFGVQCIRCTPPSSL